MIYPLRLQNFTYKDVSVDLYIPDAAFVQQYYLHQKSIDSKTVFPYWSKIWPASYALAEFIIDNKVLVQNKNVIELAAGLGLPSLVAAHYAQSVSSSDFAADAISIMEKSIAYNNLNNVSTGLLDWKHLSTSINADILLISDINYEPENFDALYNLFEKLLHKNITILLSTPQRLMATPFIERLQHFMQQTKNIEKTENNVVVAVSVFVLKKL